MFTNYALDGIESNLSESMILADVPDKPSSQPTRNIATSQSTVAVNILTVAGDHGSAITTYVIEMDDGFGGAFVPIQGELSNSLDLTTSVSENIVSSRHYRFRYRT